VLTHTQRQGGGHGVKTLFASGYDHRLPATAVHDLLRPAIQHCYAPALRVGLGVSGA